MTTAQTTYHAPHFDPTVDEIDTLKKLEMGQCFSLEEGLKHHLSGRLLERGYVGKTPVGEFCITEPGRQLIRRQNN